MLDRDQVRYSRKTTFQVADNTAQKTIRIRLIERLVRSIELPAYGDKILCRTLSSSTRVVIRIRVDHRRPPTHGVDVQTISRSWAMPQSAPEATPNSSQ